MKRLTIPLAILLLVMGPDIRHIVLAAECTAEGGQLQHVEYQHLSRVSPLRVDRCVVTGQPMWYDLHEEEAAPLVRVSA